MTFEQTKANIEQFSIYSLKRLSILNINWPLRASVALQFNWATFDIQRLLVEPYCVYRVYTKWHTTELTINIVKTLQRLDSI